MATALYSLPPLILHPFSEAAGSVELLESAKAAAQKILAGGELPGQAEILRERLVTGRYAELRMLFFVGKDIFRWLGQCLDFAQRTESLKGQGLMAQSFAQLLIDQTPPDVQAKLKRWGVFDYASVFARSIGIQAQFQEPPSREILSEDYLRNYHRFVDYSYSCWKEGVRFPLLLAGDFVFSLYASGEYSKLLAQQWQT